MTYGRSTTVGWRAVVAKEQANLVAVAVAPSARCTLYTHPTDRYRAEGTRGLTTVGVEADGCEQLAQTRRIYAASSWPGIELASS